MRDKTFIFREVADSQDGHPWNQLTDHKQTTDILSRLIGDTMRRHDSVEAMTAELSYYIKQLQAAKGALENAEALP